MAIEADASDGSAAAPVRASRSISRASAWALGSAPRTAREPRSIPRSGRVRSGSPGCGSHPIRSSAGPRRPRTHARRCSRDASSRKRSHQPMPWSRADHTVSSVSSAERPGEAEEPRRRGSPRHDRRPGVVDELRPLLRRQLAEGRRDPIEERLVVPDADERVGAGVHDDGPVRSGGDERPLGLDQHRLGPAAGAHEQRHVPDAVAVAPARAGSGAATGTRPARRGTPRPSG